MKQTAKTGKFLLQILAVFFILTAGTAHAACTSPVGVEGDIIYNGDYHTYQFCNGTDWKAYHEGEAWRPQRAFNPTYPAGVGFFVMSHGTYDGNLGGRQAS